MSFKDIWTDIIDGVSEIRGEDINNIAHEVLNLIDNIDRINNEIADIKFRATNHESRLSSAENMLIDNSNMIGYLDNSLIALSEQVGNIDTALDNIISIQNSYIGGDNE